MNKKAYIFDLDGVLTDTAECHYLAWKQLADQHDLSFDVAFNEHLKGVSRVDSLKLILNHNDRQVDGDTLEEWLALKNSYYLKQVQKTTPGDLLPGALDILNDLKSRQKKIALGSASKNARLVLDKLEITAYFDVIGDGNSVERSKPAPDLFLFAARQMQVDADDCVVVEDSQAGIDAAIAAGMSVIGIDVANALQNAGQLYSSMQELNESLKNIEECSRS